jgi:glycerol-3-phosphate dehydrogenase (NAD(P)+)
MAFERIAVVGAGAWGIALANMLAQAGRMVTLAGRDPAGAQALAGARMSPRLPDVVIDARIAIVAAGAAGLSGQDAVLVAVPSQQMRSAMKILAPRLADGAAVIACAKGIERGSHKFMTEVIAECAPAARPAILSGPSFAEDVAHGLPTAVTLAAREEATAAALARALGSATFRPYHSTDVRGVEIGGAAKNVLAIAAGIVAGRGLGASAAAALTTRGFAELFRFGQAFGARPATLTGLSGLGDLILTCSSPQSRNFALGIALGQDRGRDDQRRKRPEPPARPGGQLAEGMYTAAVLVEMARQKDVDMPIATAVAAILAGQISVDEAIENLLTRPFRAEG